jgi:beta-glucanase (GH16 family)
VSTLRFAAAALLALAGAAQASDVPAGYQLVWADEFDVDGLPDPARWDHDTGRNKDGWHNHELQYYADRRAENAVVKGGRLLITARKESMSGAADWGGQRYTSARLLTRGRADWTYGFFEIRARMPCGLGTWPAIWMLGRQGDWPALGELDILEHLGREPARVFSSVHTAAGSGGHAVGGAQPLADACTAFHRYQMHWTHDDLRFGVDGFVHLRYPKLEGSPRAWPFDAPQFLILNLAIGGDLGGPVDDRIFPAVMEVDYVRVYQKKPR